MPDQTRHRRGTRRSPEPRSASDKGQPVWRKRRLWLLLVVLATDAFFGVLFYGVLSKRSGCTGLTGEQLSICQARESAGDQALLFVLLLFLVVTNVTFAVVYLLGRRSRRG
jgi:hypothetical protein